jgi:hypothetical protein
MAAFRRSSTVRLEIPCDPSRANDYALYKGILRKAKAASDVEVGPLGLMVLSVRILEKPEARPAAAKSSRTVKAARASKSRAK